MIGYVLDLAKTILIVDCVLVTMYEQFIIGCAIARELTWIGENSYKAALAR